MLHLLFYLKTDKGDGEMNNIDLDLVRYLLCWCEDAQDREMIQKRHYTYDYFGDYEIISEDELDALCNYINPLLKLCDCTLRITWSMGEFIPVRNPHLIIQIDREGV